MFKDVELRKLPAGSLYSLMEILEINKDWKKVMSVIPKNPLDVNSELKYNTEHIRLIEENSLTTGKKCAEILFEEWSTSGKVRPTLGILRNVVEKAQIYRAVDEISLMIEEPSPSRPTDGPGARIEINVSELLGNPNSGYSNDSTQQIFSPKNNRENTTVQMLSDSNFYSNIKSEDIPNWDMLQANKITKSMDSKYNPQTNDTTNSNGISARGNLHANNTESTDISDKYEYQHSLPNIQLDTQKGIDTCILHDTNLIHFEYGVLENITNKFSDKLVTGANGYLTGRIGEGGFGEVFAGYHEKYGHLAVKRNRNNAYIEKRPDIAYKIFNSEVRNLSKFRHHNIVPILGYSYEDQRLCIVCKYIEGGSLERKIAAKVLTEKQRLNIMAGTAEGLKYLHKNDKNADVIDDNVTKKNYFIHGDVKSANILLTHDYIPKLCDFGLAKQFDTTSDMTSSPMGTSAYMAPEGFSGTITQKIDIYSFGIVLLELLTGLRPIISNRNGTINIKIYVEENSVNGEIKSVLDPVVPEWTKSKEVYDLSKKCLQAERKNRPNITEVCDILQEIN